jgi:hypothetical protein
MDGSRRSTVGRKRKQDARKAAAKQAALDATAAAKQAALDDFLARQVQQDLEGRERVAMLKQAAAQRAAAAAATAAAAAQPGATKAPLAAHTQGKRPAFRKKSAKKLVCGVTAGVGMQCRHRAVVLGSATTTA